jgi:hypothetical protein
MEDVLIFLWYRDDAKCGISLSCHRNLILLGERDVTVLSVDPSDCYI